MGCVMLEKIYPESYIDIEEENVKNFLIELSKMEKNVKEKYGEDFYRPYMIGIHDIVREILNLPNKVFTIGMNTDESLVRLIFFPIEPNKKSYDVKRHEETREPYLLIESE